MEALEPGKPLSFLDHRIQHGNSLLGTTPALMAQGIPDDAFNPIEGDDLKIAAALKKQNKGDLKEREKTRQGQLDMFADFDTAFANDRQASALDEINHLPDDNREAIRQMEERYNALLTDPDFRNKRLAADAWCAAFVWEKRAEPGQPVLTDRFFWMLVENPDSEVARRLGTQVLMLRDHYKFFHWHVAFSDVFNVPDDPKTAENPQAGWNGGRGCVFPPPHSREP